MGSAARKGGRRKRVKGGKEGKKEMGKDKGQDGQTEGTQVYEWDG